MKLYLNGCKERYATEQIMMMLFPGDRPESVTERPTEGDFAEVFFRKNTHRIFARVEICMGDATHRGGAVERMDDCADDPIEVARRMRQIIKIAFYKAAVQHLPKPPEWGAMTGIRPAKVAAALLSQGLSEKQTADVLKEKYFVQQKRRELAIICAKAGMRAMASNAPRDVSLYIGIPFCASRCKYCSFVSHSIDKAGHLVAPYLDALEREIELVGKTARELGLSVKTVYIGGGTPTALSAGDLRRVMELVRTHFDITEISEYTVEAGRPDTVDLEKIQVISEYGATRISANPQSMDDRVLELMGRNHTSADIVRMVHDIRKVGGLDINMDVIAGLPGDSVSGFRDTMRRVIELQPENITVHTLAIKKGSALRDEAMEMPSGDDTAEMVDLAMNEVSNAGFAPYYLYRQKYMSGNLENVGYSKAGKEGLYNILIMEEIHTILSLGAGGVTKLVNHNAGQIVRIFNPKYPYEYNHAYDKIEESCRKMREFYKNVR